MKCSKKSKLMQIMKQFVSEYVLIWPGQTIGQACLMNIRMYQIFTQPNEYYHHIKSKLMQIMKQFVSEYVLIWPGQTIGYACLITSPPPPQIIRKISILVRYMLHGMQSTYFSLFTLAQEQKMVQKSLFIFFV